MDRSVNMLLPIALSQFELQQHTMWLRDGALSIESRRHFGITDPVEHYTSW